MRQQFHNMLRLCAIGLVTVLALAPAAVLAASATATSSVNVRAHASTSATIVDRLYAGETVDVRGCRGGWCYVTHSGPDGWVAASYLSHRGLHMDPNFNFSFTFGGGQFSFGVGTPAQTSAAEVCFYKDVNYGGRAFCLGEGSSRARLPAAWNDTISSFRNPGGLRVTVCANWDYNDCRLYTSGARNLGEFNDQASSIKVR